MNLRKQAGRHVSFLTQFIRSLFLADRRRKPRPSSGRPEGEHSSCCTRAGACKPRPRSRPREKSSPTPKFAPKGWHAATSSETVVAALVKDKTLPDPFFGMNLRSFPGVNYPIGGNFSNIPMAPDSPYAVSWWYRKQFALPGIVQGQDGLAELRRHQLPRQHLAQRKADRQLGRRRRRVAHVRVQHYRAAKPGAENVLAVQAFSPTETRPGHHVCRLESVASRQEHGTLARSVPDHQRPGRAALSHSGFEAESAGKRQRPTHRHGAGEEWHRSAGQGHAERTDRERRSSSRTWNSRPNEAKDVTFTPDQFQQLNFSNPRLWWPAQMGTPNLYELNM